MEIRRTEVLIDNTTLIGVSQLICKPKIHLSAYTLLDLETFCEAFILYDDVMSLRGHSGQMLKKVLASDNLEGMEKLLIEMRAAGIFSTQYAREFGFVDDDVLFDILSNMALKNERIFNWPRILVDRYIQREGAFAGIGKADEEKITYPISIGELYYPTIWYMLVSMYEGKPYLGTSIRVPIIRQLVKEINYQSSSVIEKCLETTERPFRAKVERVLHEFPKQDVRLVLPPLLRYVLEQCNESEDIISAVARLRNRPDVKVFRQWCQKFQHNIDVGDIDGIYNNLNSLESLSQQFVKEPDAIITDIYSVITIAASPLSSLLSLVKNNSRQFLSWIRNRHFLFLKKLSNSAQTIESNRILIKKVFGKDLSDEDLGIYAELSKLDDLV